MAIRDRFSKKRKKCRCNKRENGVKDLRPRRHEARKTIERNEEDIRPASGNKKQSSENSVSSGEKDFEKDRRTQRRVFKVRQDECRRQVSFTPDERPARNVDLPKKEYRRKTERIEARRRCYVEGEEYWEGAKAREKNDTCSERRRKGYDAGRTTCLFSRPKKSVLDPVATLVLVLFLRSDLYGAWQKREQLFRGKPGQRPIGHLV
ncbi:UNVERIFIED_CONTAM: hypothetical protein HHA_454580 [Hammondia hammondi]|eukprot:XP_008888177.1 hypothetical protein HHA_454580 [Hammondia hammondi]